MKSRKERFDKIKESLVRLFNPKKWTKEEKKEFKTLVLLTILIASSFFYLGRVYECNKQDGVLGSYKDDSFVTKYVFPECKFNTTIEEPTKSEFEIVQKVKDIIYKTKQ